MSEYVNIGFVADQIVAHPSIAECVRADGPRATLITADGRRYEGAIQTRWSDSEVLERLTNATSRVCDAAFAAGHRWSCLYEASSLVHGVETIILAERNDQ